MKVYIYSLKDPITKEIRYVGKTVNMKNRLQNHIYKAKKGKTHRDNWIKKLLKQNLLPEMELIEVCDESNWVDREVYWIDYYDNLTNHALGGEGYTRSGKNDIKCNSDIDELIIKVINLLNNTNKTDREIEIELELSKSFISRARKGYIKYINSLKIKIPKPNRKHGGGWNKGKKLKNRNSGKGYYYNKKQKRWIVSSYCEQGKRKHLGSFKTEKEAIDCRQKYLKK